MRTRANEPRQGRQKQPVTAIMRRGTHILPMFSFMANMASLRRMRHVGDFRARKNHNQHQNSLDRLLRDLKA